MLGFTVFFGVVQSVEGSLQVYIAYSHASRLRAIEFSLLTLHSLLRVLAAFLSPPSYA
jgi:hypothetical protein